MVNIDVRSLGHYRLTFNSWFVPTLLLANFLYVRSKSRLSLLEVLAADIGMTAVSWLLIAGVPVVPLLVWELVLVILRRGSDGPVVALIPVFLMSVLFSAICQSALLRCFKQRVAKSEFWLLAGINLLCLLLAFYRMYVFAIAHPPEA
jgi:hypothetical protein